MTAVRLTGRAAARVSLLVQAAASAPRQPAPRRRAWRALSSAAPADMAPAIPAGVTDPQHIRNIAVCARTFH
jgi:hypothetical protein